MSSPDFDRLHCLCPPYYEHIRGIQPHYDELTMQFLDVLSTSQVQRVRYTQAKLDINLIMCCHGRFVPSSLALTRWVVTGLDSCRWCCIV